MHHWAMPWASQKRKINKRRHFRQMFKKKRKKIPFCIVLVISSELFIIRSRTQRTVSYLLSLQVPKTWLSIILRNSKVGKLDASPLLLLGFSLCQDFYQSYWGVCAEPWKQQLAKQTEAATAAVTKQSYKLKNRRGFMLWTPDGSRTVQFVNCT